MKIKFEYISLFLMALFTIFTIVNNQISVFYIIYLFWFDEFLRTSFKFGFYLFKREKIDQQEAYWKTIKDKMFILFVYFIFILVFFGLMIDWENSDLILINFEVLLFKNTMFNLTIAIFLARELMLYFKDGLKNFNENVFLSNGVIILHISIIIGMVIWKFLPSYIYENSNSNVLSGIVIAPFLLLKLFFEIKEIREEHVKDINIEL